IKVPKYFTTRKRNKTVKNIMVYQTHMKVALSILAILALGLGSSSKATAMQGRVVRVVSTDAIAGQPGNVSVELDSLGNESSVKFSLNFDSAIFTAPD